MKHLAQGAALLLVLVAGSVMAEQPSEFIPRQTGHGAMLIPSASDTSLNGAKRDELQERNENLGVAFYHNKTNR